MAAHKLTRRERERIAGLSVVALSALMLGGAWTTVVAQDRVSVAAVAAPVASGGSRVAPASVRTAAEAQSPAPGLQRVQRPRRRVVVVRRTRAS